MYIFYNENEVRQRGGFMMPYHKQDANKKFMDHYSNYIILNEILKKPKDFGEKVQAVKELNICEKKMEYWKKHANFDQNLANKQVEDLKSLWSNRKSG